MSDLDRERLDVISEALAGVIRGQRHAEARLARIEKALGLPEFQAELPKDCAAPRPIPPAPGSNATGGDAAS